MIPPWPASGSGARSFSARDVSTAGGGEKMERWKIPFAEADLWGFIGIYWDLLGFILGFNGIYWDLMSFILGGWLVMIEFIVPEYAQPIGISWGLLHDVTCMTHARSHLEPTRVISSDTDQSSRKPGIIRWYLHIPSHWTYYPRIRQLRCS